MNRCPGERISQGRWGDGSRRIWLVRHGESTWNAAGLVQGHLDPSLSDLGRAQAARCGQFFAEQPAPEALYSSDLGRSLETAGIISSALGLAVRVDSDLRERSLGDAEGRPTQDLGPDRSGITGSRVVDADAAPRGGETVRQLFERAVSCASRILEAYHGDVVLVCHGGIVRVLLAWLDGAGVDDMAWPEVANGDPISRDVPCVLTSA